MFDRGPSVLDTPAAEVPIRPEPRVSVAIALANPAVPATFVLPASCRPDGAAAPESCPVLPFAFHESRSRSTVYKTPLPIRADLLPTATEGTHRFGSFAPPGLSVNGPKGGLPFSMNAKNANSWGFDPDWLFVAAPVGLSAPDPDGISVVFPKATATENAMNLATSGLSPEAFARRTFTVGTVSHSGLFLPAPAEAVFPLTVPEAGRLSFDAQLLAPAIRSETASDGASITVAVRVGGVETAVTGIGVTPGETTPARVDLAAWAGQAVELVIRTVPGGTSTFDYLLLEGPTVYTPKEDPERILMVFVDTLRPDHLHYMGYDRPTSPVLDRLAAHATVFTEARSVAPWTLPSARALLTGREPEHWYESETLPQTLAAAGWRTDAIVTNAFLSQPFDVQRGWDRFSYEQRMGPEDVVGRALGVIEANPDRDLLLMVHFMGPHIPYEEPLAFRYLFAGDEPASLKRLSRAELVRVHSSQADFAEVRSYVTARYDQNVAYVDDSLAPLFEAAGGRATVVVFSDHGEELWDHNGFEHGHTFYDELLRVVLTIRSPYLPPGRQDATVSLVDVAPTLWELAGVAAPAGVTGRSLVGLGWGDPEARPAFDARPLAFGRPLYGPDGWGVLARDGTSPTKWWDRKGVQQIFAIGGDSRERIDLAVGAPHIERWPEALGEALGQPVHEVWRVEIQAPEDWPADLDLTLSHPAGLDRVWAGYDPRGRAATAPVVVDGRVTLHLESHAQIPRTLYIVPHGDPAEPGGLVATLVGRGVQFAAVSESPRLGLSHDPPTILKMGDKRFDVTVELGWVPEPVGTEVAGFHPELEDQLRELGYLDPGPEDR